MTRKKERVDVSDTLHNIRSDDTRINEGVAYLARGNNYMQDVNYSNHGAGGATTMPNLESKNPYRNSESFRPPIYKQEDLYPLSRMPHSNFAVSTNPGIRGGFVTPLLQERSDKAEQQTAIAKKKINYISIRPTVVYNLTKQPEPSNYSHAIDDRRVSYSATTNLSSNQTDSSRGTDQINQEQYIKDNPLLKNISSNFSIVIYNTGNQDYTEVKGSVKDKMNIAVASSLSRPIDLTRDDGTPIKLKEYRYKVVQSNVSGGRDTLVVYPSTDIYLDRNTPLYSAESNVSGYQQDARFNEDGDVILADRPQMTASAPVSRSYGQNDPRYSSENNVSLRRQGNYGEFINDRNIPTDQVRNMPHLKNKFHAQIDEADRYMRF
jgi:hypothetical protein